MVAALLGRRARRNEGRGSTQGQRAARPNQHPKHRPRAQEPSRGGRGEVRHCRTMIVAIDSLREGLSKVRHHSDCTFVQVVHCQEAKREEIVRPQQLWSFASGHCRVLFEKVNVEAKTKTQEQERESAGANGQPRASPERSAPRGQRRPAGDAEATASAQIFQFPASPPRRRGTDPRPAQGRCARGAAPAEGSVARRCDVRRGGAGRAPERRKRRLGRVAALSGAGARKTAAAAHGSARGSQGVEARERARRAGGGPSRGRAASPRRRGRGGRRGPGRPEGPQAAV